MAVSLNRLIRERRVYVGQLRRMQKAVDSQLERVERKLKQMLARKLKVPEEADLETLAVYLRDTVSLILELSKALEEGYPL